MKLLFENFAALAESPNGVPRLRELILQLAVRGRLVPQDPNDEPASELLKRIKAEKEKLISEGKIRKEKPLTPIAKSLIPYNLPEEWEWTRLQELGTINPRNYVSDEIEVSFSPMNLVPAEYGTPLQFEKSRWKEVKKGFTHFQENDVLVAKITPCFQNGKAAVARNTINGYGAGTTELYVFRGICTLLLPDYVYVYFKSPRFLAQGIGNMTGTAGQQRVPKSYISLNPFPLPPLAEQKRIVAKVDALMTLCDQLETNLRQSQTVAEKLMYAVIQEVLSAD